MKYRLVKPIEGIKATYGGCTATLVDWHQDNEGRRVWREVDTGEQIAVFDCDWGWIPLYGAGETRTELLAAGVIRPFTEAELNAKTYFGLPLYT